MAIKPVRVTPFYTQTQYEQNESFIESMSYFVKALTPEESKIIQKVFRNSLPANLDAIKVHLLNVRYTFSKLKGVSAPVENFLNALEEQVPTWQNWCSVHMLLEINFNAGE